MATKRGDIVEYLVCNVNGLLREMGGRTQRDAVNVSERLRTHWAQVRGKRNER